MIKIQPKHSILRQIVVGYEAIEPCIMAALALEQPIYIESGHGVGKTTLGKFLGKAVDFSGRGFRFYSCDKAGIVDIAGLPDLDSASKSGKLSFIPHDKSIFGADVIIADELTRASKDRMNGWLEICEEKTYMGIPLKYRLLIATGNNSTYTGTYKFDPALKSRFIFYLPLNNFNRIDAEDVNDMIRLNVGDRDINKLAYDVGEVISYIKEKLDLYKKDPDIQEQIASFISSFIQLVTEKIASSPKLSEEPDAYISPREYSKQMPLGLMALAAYFDRLGYSNPFQVAGEYVVKYTIETRHAAAGADFKNIIEMAWKQFRPMLADGINTPVGKLKSKFAIAISPVQKIGFWRDNINQAADILDVADITTMAGDTLQQIESCGISHVGNFWEIMSSNNKTKHIANEIEGFVITEIARRMMVATTDVASKEAKLIYSQLSNQIAISSADVSRILGIN